MYPSDLRFHPGESPRCDTVVHPSPEFVVSLEHPRYAAIPDSAMTGRE
jgi:hypothetical protein